MQIIISILLNALSLYIGAWLLPGVELLGVWPAIIAGAILGLANILIKPLLVILTIPVTIITLGLFLLVVNAIVLLLVDAVVGGFEIYDLWNAILLGIVIWILNLIYGWLNLD